jgi:hypothetical protein
LKAEAFYGLPVTTDMCLGRFHGHYNPMNMTNASWPEQFNQFPVYPDDSPDFLAPIGVTGYIGTEYH